jgi:hypothetical protein
MRSATKSSAGGYVPGIDAAGRKKLRELARRVRQIGAERCAPESLEYYAALGELAGVVMELLAVHDRRRSKGRGVANG